MNRKPLLATLFTMMVLALAATAIAQGTKSPAPDESNLMDLNSAPPEKLMTLPGIDLITARKIIAGRPYKTKNDLVAKKIMPQDAFNTITNRVTVRPIPKAAPPR